MEGTVMDCLVLLAGLTVGLGYALRREQQHRVELARARRAEAERLRRAER